MALHKAGAAAPNERKHACPCAQAARYRELRSCWIFTVLNEVEITQPWFLCCVCGRGLAPLPTSNCHLTTRTLSPGVRQMLVLVGSDALVDHGRQPIELLARLAITTKAGERTAESIGDDLAGVRSPR